MLVVLPGVSPIRANIVSSTEILTGETLIPGDSSV